MDKFEIYGCLILSLMSVFMLGVYTHATIVGTTEIESYQWAFTSFFGFIFFNSFCYWYRK